MRRLALAFFLACLLSGGARAGEIHPTGVVAPPTSGTVTAAGEIPSTGGQVTTTGEIHTTGETAPEASSTLLTMILTLISIVR